jgi:hypothetical protein
VRKGIPILIDAERVREGLDDLLELADYAICSAKFPQASFFFFLINNIFIEEEPPSIQEIYLMI